MKILSSILANITFSSKGELPDSINQISNNSEKINREDIFVAIVGEKVDGHTFINQAIEKGASVLLVEKFVDVEIPQIKVSNTKVALSQLAANYYNNPTEKMKIAGITGTNGKTTVVYLLSKIFTIAGYSNGSVGTLGYTINKNSFDTNLTTPDSLELQKIFAEMVDVGVTHAAIEVSSHSIALNRISNICFDGVAFTNISQDHLDYHQTMEDYAKTKAKLFDATDGFKICNIDDDYSNHFIEKGDVLTTSIKKQSDFKWKDGAEYKSGIKGIIDSPYGDVKIETRLSGNFNLYNILTAVSTALEMGISVDAIEQSFLNIAYIPGRLQEIKTKKRTRVFIDYAHTPDAIENVLMALHDILPETGKLISLFGCGGNRDKTKRPKMARSAENFSDLCILTSDNPRFEDPRDIIEDAAKGFSGKVSFKKFVDRKEAIEYGLSIAGDDDIFAILGKGHENYIDEMGKKRNFDEKQIIMDFYEK